MAYYNDIPTLEGKIKELERRMSTTETAPRLSASAIGSGGLTVNDGGSITIRDGGELNVSGPTTLGGPTNLSSTLTVGNGGDVVVRGGRLKVQTPAGVDQVRMGVLTNGTYGVEQLVGSNWVPLLQLASGVVSNGISTATFGFTAPANATSAWETGSTPTSFTTYTGRVTVMITVNTTWYGNKSSIALGYQVKNSGGTVVLAPSLGRASAVSNNTGVDQSQTILYIETLNLTPGNYVVDQFYLLMSGVAEASWANISNRSLMVFPF